MKWKVLVNKQFQKDFDKLIPQHIKPRIKKGIEKLALNPYSGKPLGYKYFREKKFEQWRIYYLLYQHKLIIFFVGLSNKKMQQEKIHELKTLFKYFNNILK